MGYKNYSCEANGPRLVVSVILRVDSMYRARAHPPGSPGGSLVN